MGYFSDHYASITYPQSTVSSPVGLRNAQIGAIHSIASHFTLHSAEACLIVLPTGAGKTAVLNLVPYILRSKRVLVLSSSILVRGQITNEFEVLKTLKQSGVFPNDLSVPKVKEVCSPIKTEQQWSSLEDFDVVIGIPNSINEGLNNGISPPKDLFDLILVDEAHHVPAFTWTNIVSYFLGAQKVFFTATPFRRDKQEIKGRLAYNYPLSKAYDDKIFGDIVYYPVTDAGKDRDLAIALEAEKVFKADKEAGKRHAMMVRTGSKAQAKILQKLYQEKTTLNLKRVDSSVTFNTVKKTIKALRAGELDGIICVDMMGEGFDFPNLKIAAIHEPKKSLANTLQFIGRFARTNAENIGEAKFIATPSDLRIGRRLLYAEDTIWNDVIKELSQEAIEIEDELKKVADSFVTEQFSTTEEEISFFNLNPFCHVKIYWSDGLKIDQDLVVAGQKVVFHSKSPELNTLLFVTKEVEKPKWLIANDVINVHHYFYLLYYDAETGILFIHSSIKSPQFYDYLKNTFSLGNTERISKAETHRVLLDIKDAECFNIGLLNRSANSGESYLTRTGSKADKMILPGDARNYANGHVFLKGNFDSNSITIGYSSGAKVWSNSYQRVPDFINWCKVLGQKIASNRIVKTNTGFDYLPIGEKVKRFPLPVYAADWHRHTYQQIVSIIGLQEDEVIFEIPLHDCHVKIDVANSTPDLVVIQIERDSFLLELSYDFHNFIQIRSKHHEKLLINLENVSMGIDAYFREHPFQIYLDDFATVIDHEYYPPPKVELKYYDVGDLQAHNWKSSNTDITVEFYKDSASKIANGNRNSIHESLNEKLIAEAYPVLIYDHGSGEIADFITFLENSDNIAITLYHVKGSGGKAPGDRVGDVYEVAMQAIKSLNWTINKSYFRKKVLDRIKGKPDKFLLGDQKEFERILSISKRLDFHFVIVQPGISKKPFSRKMSYLLGAANDNIARGSSSTFQVIGS